MIAKIYESAVKGRSETGIHYVEISCLSTDPKPVNSIATGSIAIEVDTGDVYFFDEVAGAWNKILSLKEE